MSEANTRRLVHHHSRGPWEAVESTNRFFPYSVYPVGFEREKGPLALVSDGPGIPAHGNALVMAESVSLLHTGIVLVQYCRSISPCDGGGDPEPVRAMNKILDRLSITV